MLHVNKNGKCQLLCKYYFNYFYCLPSILTMIILSSFKRMTHDSLKCTSTSFIWIWLVSTSSTGSKSNQSLWWEIRSHFGNMTTDCRGHSQLGFYTYCPRVPGETDSKPGLCKQGVYWESEGRRTGEQERSVSSWPGPSNCPQLRQGARPLYPMSSRCCTWAIPSVGVLPWVRQLPLA